MSEITPSSQNLDRYLKQIEKHEQSKVRKKRTRVIVLILLVGIASVSAWQYFGSSPKEPQVVSADYQDLNITKVADFFKEDGNTLIINYPFDLRSNTVKSLERYLEIIAEDESYNKYVTNGSGGGVLGMNAEGTDANQDMNTSSLENTSFYVGGNWVEDRSLIFAISTFDSTLQYEFNFGNGVKRTVEEPVTRFTYWRPGRFTVKMTVKDSTGTTMVREKILNIASASDPEPESTPSNKQEYAEKATPPTQDVAISTEIPDEEQENDITNQEEEHTTEEIRELTAINSSVGSESMLESQALESPQTQTQELTQRSETTPKQAKTETVSEPQPKESESSQPQNIDFSSYGRVLVSSEVSPKFPGGNNGLARYFNRGMRYPQQAISEKVEGRVIVRFIIDKNGNIRQPKVMKGIGYGCDEEALRLISLMPNWKPGFQGGEAVSVYHQLAIKFELR